MARLSRFPLELIDADQISAIHTASLDILTRIGLRLEDEELVSMLLDCGGARSNGRIIFPSELIETAIGNLKTDITLAYPKGEKHRICSGSVLTHTSTSIPFVYDSSSGVKRDATEQDLVAMVRLMNHLDHLDLPGALVLPLEYPPPVAEIHQSATLLRHAQKPTIASGTASGATAGYVVRLYQALCGSTEALRRHPPAFISTGPKSPLFYPAGTLEAMKIVLRAGIPTACMPAPVLGFSAPLTFAGGIAQMNASLLAFVTLAYLIEPKTPLIYGGRLSAANMHTGNSIWGLPAIAQAGVWTVQLARHYGMPSDVYGLSTSSCTYDTQAGYEKTANTVLPLLAGANILSGFGSLVSLLLASYEQLVIDDELFGMLLHGTDSPPVSDDTLALEAIHQAMAGEPFIEQVHTFAHVHDAEIYRPQLGFAGLWSEWLQEGTRDIRQRAGEKVRALLNIQDEQILPAEIEREFKDILAAADRELL